MKIQRYASYLLTASVLPLVALGCTCTHEGKQGGGHTLQRDFGKEIPPGAMPDAPGEHVRRFQATQVKNAEAIQYAVFLNEWYMGGTELGPYGEHHVQRMIRYLPTVPHPVLIQPAPDAAINEIRRNVIVGKLLNGGILDAETRVRIANPDAEGLFGDEAPRIYDQMLRSNAYSGLGSGLQGGFNPFGSPFGGGGGFGFGGSFPGFGGAFGPGVIPY